MAERDSRRRLFAHEPPIVGTSEASRRRAPSTAFSDLAPSEWRVRPDILTDSLWILGSRDKTGAHTGEYHGNFVPQIPRQLIQRFTKQGEVVLDPFVGSGTTLIECKRLGRHGIGIELLPAVAREAQLRVDKEGNPYGVSTALVVGDSTLAETFESARQSAAWFATTGAHLAILHPPYHDIIKFSDDPRDLCNAPTLEAFLDRFRSALGHALRLLRPGRFAAVVIGDKYAEGEWVPLGFYVLKVCQDAGLTLKSIIVKDMLNNRAKRNLEHLWKYRALAHGFYIFRHEYILLFRKQRSGHACADNARPDC